MSRLSTVGATLVVLGLAPASSQDAAAEPTRSNASVRIEVLGFDSTKGKARCGLFAKKGWGEEGKMMTGVEADIRKGRATCMFSQVDPGRYGVIVYHDENGNGKLDKNFLGIPSEDYCFSEDAKGGLGVPDFEDAAFDVEASLVSTRCSL